MKTQYVIGSRGSHLALWQARHIAARLEALGAAARIEIIKTTGDKITDVALAKVGEASGLKGVFTKEIEEALLDGRIDLAVHSLKDLPTELPPGLMLSAVPEREDPRDALVGKPLAELEPGDRVGTSSLRRAAQLRFLQPGLDIQDIRGNVETRLRKLDEGGYDAILLACAGLHRLELSDRITEALEPDVMAPAVGQGALGIEIRDDDAETAALMLRLEHRETRLAVEAERALLDALGGGCQVPLGAHAVVEGETLRLTAAVAAPDGATLIRDETSGQAAQAAGLGRALAESLLQKGAADLIQSATA